MAKQIIFNEEARKKLQEGVNIVANAPKRAGAVFLRPPA